jgi:hypothetical protein
MRESCLSFTAAVLGCLAALVLTVDANQTPANQSPASPARAAPRPPITMTRENLSLIATIDLMKAEWTYAPCKVIKEGTQAGFTWVADGYKRDYVENPADGWKTLDHLPRGGREPGETMQPGISCGWFRRAIELSAKVGDVDVTGATPYLVYTVDDYSETYVDGHYEFMLPNTGMIAPFGQNMPWDIKGFNVPVVIDLTGRPYELKVGDKFQLAIFAVNGPIPVPYGGYFFRFCRIEFRK